MLFRIIWGVILSLQMMVAQAAGLNQITWDALLKKHVITLQGGQVTQVNYAGMQQDKSRLGIYLQSTSAVSRSEFERDKLDELISELQSLRDDCEEAFDALQTARDALSRLL